MLQVLLEGVEAPTGHMPRVQVIRVDDDYFFLSQLITFTKLKA